VHMWMKAVPSPAVPVAANDGAEEHERKGDERPHQEDHHHGTEGHGGEGVVEDGDGVQAERDPEARVRRISLAASRMSFDSCRYALDDMSSNICQVLPEAQPGEEPRGEQHGLDPVLALVARVVPARDVPTNRVATL